MVNCGEGNGTPLQYSCLENPMDGGAWKAAVHVVAKIQTRLSDFTFPFLFHALEKEMATHSSVLAWRIPGMGEPAIYGVAQSWTRLKQLSSSSSKETKAPYTENYKTIMKEIKDNIKQMERCSMFLGRKNQYCESDYTTK